ncbi:MAG: cobyrinate a,c-diamide synthase [Magnetococcales bacterium]|nr:cobyrinate a,c-diamide synthase [Magnetococcales bacterium]
MTREKKPGFVIGAVQSRSGKTTVTLALLARLGRAGVAVAPFKAGPDFIDPAWHRTLCGRPSYNLDTVMVGPDACRELFHGRRGAALGVVEGVMGLYDGRAGVGGPGSTAHLAAVLDLPVLLVVDARGMAGSIVPLVDGFVRAARGFVLAGVLANNVGSAHHGHWLQEALAEAGLPPLLGWLRRNPALALEERHLGLVLPQDQPAPETAILEENLEVDVERLLAALPAAPEVPLPPPVFARPLLAGAVVGVARDAAFCFLYQANLDWLAAMGAEVRFFSPLAGQSLPADATALWLPGGYPELHAAALANSAGCWAGVRAFAAGGGPILAECGGMMALGQELIDTSGQPWPMAGVLPIRTRMTGRLAGLGYRSEVSGVRGHEFHHSTRDPCALPPAFTLERGDGGVRLGSVRASYVHWYFPSAPEEVASWLRG